MKASDWADEFRTTSDVFGSISKFVKETTELVQDRTKYSKSLPFARAAAQGALNESQAKWRAVQRQVPLLKNFGFDQIVKQVKKDAPSQVARLV